MNHIEKQSTDCKEQAQTQRLLVGLLLVAMLVTGICIYYMGTLRNITGNETKRYLTELSQQIASTINDRVRISQQILVDIANTYTNMPLKKSQEFLSEKAHEYGYKWLGIADSKSMVRTSTGQMFDMSGFKFVDDAINGVHTVSDICVPFEETQEAIYYAVPLGDSGALIACTSEKSMRTVMSVKIFDGKGYTHIIDGKGNFIIKSENINARGSLDNFFSQLEESGLVDGKKTANDMRSDMSKRKTGAFYYTMYGFHNVSIFTPLDVNDWYLLTVVPTTVADGETTDFIRTTVLLNLMIISFLALMVALIFVIQRRNQEKLRRIAFVDPITGGCNRARFEADTSAAILKSPPNTYALISMDIRKFKLINDVYGSDTGDRVLKYIYSKIASALEDGEFVGRITADRYNLLIKNTSPPEISDRISAIVDDINSFNKNIPRKYYIAFVEGVCVVEDPKINIIAIQDRANVARKNNKELRGNRLSSCLFYTDVERLRMLREQEIYNRMESAMENNEFIVYLQPKVELIGNTVAGAEALVRWLDPEKGLIPPSDFISVFEKNGFIVQLDLFVFKETCRLLRRWLDAGLRAITVSVNLSRVHLENSAFLEPYIEIFSQYNLPKGIVEIELTETLVFEDLERLINVIEQIHAAGFACSLDDFGSGYSSLNMLKDVPADVLKLDRAFFNTSGDDSSRSKFVVESVIDLARKLNMRTVSEGVETHSQVEFLRESKCDMVQGFVFSRPLPIPDFEKMAFGDDTKKLL